MRSGPFPLAHGRFRPGLVPRVPNQTRSLVGRMTCAWLRILDDSERALNQQRRSEQLKLRARLDQIVSLERRVTEVDAAIAELLKNNSRDLESISGGYSPRTPGQW